MVAATLAVTCALGPSAAGSDVEIEFDSDSAGGDGVAGQVIGSVTEGRTVVIATSESTHSTGVGGDSETNSVLEIFGLPTDANAIERSAQSAAGDGMATQVAGVGLSDVEGSVDQLSDDSVLAILLPDIAP